MDKLPVELTFIIEDTLDKVCQLIKNDQPCTEFPDLLTFEELTEKFSQEMARHMVERFVKIRSNHLKEISMECLKCGKQMERHKNTSWNRQTLWGDFRVEQDVYQYCRECKTSSRPLHSYLGTDRETWSLLVQEAAVDLATDESCQSAVEKLGRHHRGVQMNRSTALNLLHQHGLMAREFIGFKLRKALEKVAVESRQEKGAIELEVEYDGGMVPVATLHPIESDVNKPIQTTAVRGNPKRRKECRWECSEMVC